MMLGGGSSSEAAKPQDDNKDEQTLAQIGKTDLLKLAHASSVAYNLSIPNEAEQYLSGYQIVPFNDSSGLAGAVLFKGNEVIVAYKGTWSLKDVGTDLNILFSIPSFLNNIGRVHGGFYNRFQESIDFIEEEIGRYCSSRDLSVADLKFSIVGHSMGGALAPIFALKLKTDHAQAADIRVVSFGSPRVFDLPAARHYNSLLGSSTIRVTQHFSDAVTMLAPLVTGYKHAGQQYRVGVGDGEYPHLIGGYIKFIESLADDVFRARASTSVFWFFCDSIRMANSYTFGVAQQTIVNLTSSNVQAVEDSKSNDNDTALGMGDTPHN